MDEFELIERIIARFPAPKLARVGPGDDAAVTEPPAATATTIDAIVEGVHFTLPEFPAAAVGRKALAASLSDLAAMGAEAGEAYVALGVSEQTGEEFCLELADGLAEVAEREGVELLGGDISRSPVLVVAVTAVGHEPRAARLVPRAGAQPGDAVVVSGELGGAAAALRLLSEQSAIDEAEVLDEILSRQLDPRPRLAAGRVLAASGATAMIDVSDGLGADAAHVAAASGARIEIEAERIPVQAGVEQIAGGAAEALELAAGGGEDFELLACIAPDAVAAAAEALGAAGTELTEIGRVTEGEGVVVRMPDGSELEPRGFNHLG